MAFTSSSSVTASPSTQGWPYDVFLSFRGPDTRHTFIDFLYESLKRRGIRTFKDDDEMEKGDCISPSLLKGIQESQFFIPVFSKGYASSKWCLDELAITMECPDEKFKNQIVVPIFYHVEPSDVRKQEGRFGDSFKGLLEKNGKDDEVKVRKWKEALKKAGELKGHHLQNDYNGYEAKCAEGVAADIHARLNQASVAFEDNLVGLESRVNNIINWLRLASDDDDADARFIGICGMGGIGKTTTAMVVFNRFSHQFDGACFLADVRQHNIIELQKTLLTEVLKEKSGVQISNAQDGKAKIGMRLKGKKVLIVLDDVDDKLKQLDELAGGRDWFGRGSRVIITTRDAGVLRSQGVVEKYIYPIDKLGEEEGIQLFRSYAFEKEAKTDFEELCGSIARSCKGLPLALKVLGTSLCGLDVAVWESTLKDLKDKADNNIYETLKISYNRLDSKNKKIFLHIACFFRHKKEENVKDVLKSCDLQPDSAMRDLTEKSLISVTDYGTVEMHDLIQEMGWHIAREEKPRSRVWQLRDVDDMLDREIEPKDIEGIDCEVSGWGDRSVEISMKEMKKLKMLKVGDLDRVFHLKENYDHVFHLKENYLPNSLRWLEFYFYQFTSLPESFAPSKLVCLSLRSSSLQNCTITQKLDKLTLLDLSGSKALLETPDFDWMPNLRTLNLQYCEDLKVVHPSIGNLNKLVLLDLSGCSNLESLPSFNQVSSLNSLDLLNKLDKLTLLDLSGSKALLETPDFDWMPNLRTLNLQYCEDLKVVHPSIGNLNKLVLLDLSGCSNLESLPSFNQVSSLNSLDLFECIELKNFPEIKERMPHLVELELINVGIIELHSSIQQLQGLTKLYLDNCEHLVCLSNGFCELKNLKVLKIEDCGNLKSLPKNVKSLNSLEYLSLKGSNFRSLPKSFNQLPRLQHLDIRHCSELRVWSLPRTIRQLYADASFALHGNIAVITKKCSKLQSLACSFDEYFDDRKWPGHFLAEMCICFRSQRKTPCSVTFPVSSEMRLETSRTNKLRLFQYRCYDSNGISISFRYCRSLVGFAVYFFSSNDEDVSEEHYYQENDDLHCTVTAKLSQKDNGNEVFEREYVIVKLDSEEGVHMCFLYIPFSSLWPAESNININNVSPNYFLRFEVNFMNSKATSDWGCSLLYERSNTPASWDNSGSAGCTTNIGPLGILEYLNLTEKKFEHFLPEDISQLRRLQYLDISGCGRIERLPELPATIGELYANTYLASESNIVEFATKYSELYSVSFSHSMYDDQAASPVPEKLAKEFIPITQPFLNRNTPFAVTYPLDSYRDYIICKCFKYPHHDPHHDPCKISISLDPTWYNHNFVGFVVCFVFPKEVRWDTHPDIRPFRSCRLITKLTHKDNRSEPPLQTECVIGRLYDEEFDGRFDDEEDIVCFVYIPFSSLWPKSKVITDDTTPNHYLVFEASIQDLEISKNIYLENYLKTPTELSCGTQCSCGTQWSCDLLYTDDESLTKEIRRKRELGSFNRESGSSENDSGPNRTELWEFTKIVDGVQCRMVSMPECFDTEVARLLYTNSGVGILALSSNGIQKLWKCPNNEQNPTGKQYWQPNSGLLMINDVGFDLEEVVPCIDLSKNDSYIVSADDDGEVSFLDIMTFEVLTTYSPPDTPTFLVFCPCDNNIVAIGMENGTIIIYNVRVDEVEAELLEGHHEDVTGLAFSTTDPNMLVSSSADAQVCVWNIVGRRQNRRSVHIQSPDGEVCSGCTDVMFHTVQLHLLLVTHETQLAIYDTSNMERKRQWIPQGCLSAPISFATYSCNSQLVYASFTDGNIGVLDADNLTLRCCIVPSAYLFQPLLNSEDVVYAFVIAAHPQKPNQLAIGLTDGSIKVIEPLESEGEWGISPPIDIEILNGKEGEDEGRGKSLDAGQGIEVGMSKHIDSVNEKEKEREDEQRKKDLLNNDKTLSSSKQNKKIRDQSDELSVTGIQPPIVGNNASKHLWDNFINSLASFLPDKDYIELEIDQALFHHTNTRSIVVMIEDIKDLMRMECLDVSIIQVFILFLNKLCNQLQVTSIGFVSPAQISMDMVKQNAPDVTSYFINVMEHHKNKQFILAPYNQKFHWLLLVICIPSRSLYVLDPLPCDRIIEIKEILNTAFDSVSTNGPVNWKQCKCPIQPGGVECGYYVMRYMFDIVTKYSSVDCLDEAFESNIPYSINEINEIRDLWAKSFLEECRQTAESERSPANEDCETEERSVFTQLELPTGEAEQSEQTPANEDCEAEVEENQRSLIWCFWQCCSVVLKHIQRRG
ncbi:uncharacterized protein LOC116025419 [Ipomoea triloba]|uniref:uncharacterized protein LOC116025419 n=1 Tax=Ipomoea triloba TaxID=35885 RepID=UPI00125DBA50|nr:uncharacterized protein LOC116025419 [Ipomoea triloba]